jgi:hypothetical protein
MRSLGTLIRMAPVGWAQTQESASDGINDISWFSSLSSQSGGSNEAHCFLRSDGSSVAHGGCGFASCFRQRSNLLATAEHRSQHLPHTGPFQERGSIPRILALVASCRASGRCFCVASVLALHNIRIKIVTAYKADNGGREVWCEPSNQFA